VRGHGLLVLALKMLLTKICWRIVRQGCATVVPGAAQLCVP